MGWESGVSPVATIYTLWQINGRTLYKEETAKIWGDWLDQGYHGHFPWTENRLFSGA
jgi:hypothetical protein